VSHGCVPYGRASPESEPLPSFVFEVGFTESYSDLVSDAAQWLQKSSGEVRLVILVNIEENVQSRRVKQRSSETRKRIRELITEFGNTKAKDREEIDHGDSDVESDSELYKDIRSKIVVEDWVGPITATLEVRHLVDNTPELRQPPIVSPYYHFRYSSLTCIACFGERGHTPSRGVPCQYLAGEGSTGSTIVADKHRVARDARPVPGALRCEEAEMCPPIKRKPRVRRSYG
jgi:hypothetical protein